MDQEQSSSGSSQTPPPQAAPSGGQNAEAGHHKLMGVLSYLGILIIIPFLMAKDDPIVKFHLKQGLVLVIIELILSVLYRTIFGWEFAGILDLVWFAVIVLSIIGVVNVLQDKEKELPLIGPFARNFNF